MSQTAVHPLEAILRMCARAAPAPWFPRAYAEAAGIPADDILFLLDHLWLEGLIQKIGSSPEAGPGFALTAEGQRVLQDPALADRLRSGSVRGPGDRGASVRAAIRTPPRPIVSRALLAANLLVFAFGIYLAWRQSLVETFLSGPWLRQAAPGMQRVLSILHTSGALLGDDLIQGEWWRLVSTGFVHIGLLHLGMNMYALHVLGWQVEAMWGRTRFLVIYLAGLVGGSCAMVAAHPATLGAGASGALCGLMASEAVWLFLNRRFFPWALVARWRSGLTTTLVLMVVISLVPGVSGWAHLGGALAGGAAGWLLNIQRFGRPPWTWLALAGLIPVFAAGFVAIDRAREDPRWHQVEVQDFEARYLKAIRSTARDAEKVLAGMTRSQLGRDPNRRDPEQVAQALQALNQQQAELATLTVRLGSQAPYRDEVVEEARLAALAYLTSLDELVQLAAEALTQGESRPPDQEHRFRDQEQEVAKTRAAWLSLLERR